MPAMPATTTAWSLVQLAMAAGQTRMTKCDACAGATCNLTATCLTLPLPTFPRQALIVKIACYDESVSTRNACSGCVDGRCSPWHSLPDACAMCQMAKGIKEEEPERPPVHRVKAMSDIPVWKRPWTGASLPREVDARGRKVPKRPKTVTKVRCRMTCFDCARCYWSCSQCAHHVVARWRQEDRLPVAADNPIDPNFRPKAMLLRAFALTHGIRPMRRKPLLKAINKYLATPNAQVLQPLQAKGRLTQLSGSKFPLIPFTEIEGRYPCCEFPVHASTLELASGALTNLLSHLQARRIGHYPVSALRWPTTTSLHTWRGSYSSLCEYLGLPGMFPPA